MRSIIYILLPIIFILGFTAALVPPLNDPANIHPPAASPRPLDLVPRQVHNADYGSSSPPNPNSGSAGSGSTPSESAPPPPASSGSSDAPGKTKSARGPSSLSLGLSYDDDTASKPGNEGSLESGPLELLNIHLGHDVRWKRQNAGSPPDTPAQADADINRDQVHSLKLPRFSKGITGPGSGGWYKRIFTASQED